MDLLAVTEYVRDRFYELTKSRWVETSKVSLCYVELDLETYHYHSIHVLYYQDS